MSTCRRCNRQLKTEPWATLGIGKICSGKQNMKSCGQNPNDTDEIIPYDGGDIFMERKYAPTIRSARYGQQISMEKHTASGLKTNVQRIEYRHSPSGFNFGYPGSGPADTALNICLMFTDRETAHKIHQDFKFKFLCHDSDRLVISKQDIVNFIAEKKVILQQEAL